MPNKPTKSEQAKEEIFTKEIAPLMDEIAERCDKHNFPLLVAVQLYTNKTDGARIAAQSVETKKSVLPLKISSKLLRGEAKVMLDGSEDSFYVSLSDDEGNFNELPFDESALETLQEHALHCEECRVHMEDRMQAGEDISQIRILGDHDEATEEDTFTINEKLLPKMGAFFNPTKNKLVH